MIHFRSLLSDGVKIDANQFNVKVEERVERRRKESIGIERSWEERRGNK